MVITINNEEVKVEADEILLQTLLEDRDIPIMGTAVTLNNRLIRHSDWQYQNIKDGDKLVVISAAFGG